MPAATPALIGRRSIAIHHTNFRKSDNFATLADRCAFALHMGHGEHKLLRFYASCASGFRPAAEHVAKETKMSMPNVYVVRNAMIKHGIAYMKNGALFIDWDRVRLFASLDPGKTSKDDFIAPCNPTTVARMTEISALDPERILSRPIRDVIMDFAFMSEAEYQSTRRAIKRKLRILGDKK